MATAIFFSFEGFFSESFEAEIKREREKIIKILTAKP